MGLCWVNEGAGHSSLQEQEKQREKVMRPPAPWRNSVAQCGGRGEESQKGRGGPNWGAGDSGTWRTAPRPSCLQVLWLMHLRKVIGAALGKVEVLVESWKTGNKDTSWKTLPAFTMNERGKKGIA